MPLRLPPALRRHAFAAQRKFTTSSASRSSIPAKFHTYDPLSTAPAPKLGRIGRWYLPTMALITLSFGIADAIEESNRTKKQQEAPDAERNRMLLEAFADRGSLEDLEKAIAAYAKHDEEGGQKAQKREFAERCLEVQ